MMAADWIARRLRTVRGNCAGASTVEFALIAPVFFALVLGGIDLGHMAYTHAVLASAVQSAGRSAALETVDSAVLDEMVSNAINQVVANPTITITRKSYYDFDKVASPEVWSDTDKNGTCNAGEEYIEENGNARWDKDVGVDGVGGPNDVVVYRVELEYTSPVGFRLLPSTGPKRTLVATTVRKNQPFGRQAAYRSTKGVCK